MKNQEPFGLEKGHMLAILAVLFLVTRLPLLTAVPFMQDEGLYAVMIEEQIEHPTTVVTFLGYEVGWKPPLFFWAYAPFVEVLRDLPIPLEAVYRLPNMLFGLLNVFLVFFIFEKIAGRKEAFLVALLYCASALAVHTETRVLLDTMCATFVFAGILSYMKGASDRRFFIVGGLLTFLAYFTKQMNAALIPALALVYVFETDRKKLKDPLFLSSLIALPLAVWIFDVSIAHLVAPGSANAYILEKHLLANLNLESIGGSLMTIFIYTTFWLLISFFGFLGNWRKSLMMSAWYCLSVFPLLGGNFMPWYFYPVLPAFAFFSLQFFMHDQKGKVVMDRFFYAILFLVAVLSLAMGVFMHLAYAEYYGPHKAAAEWLSGKENVMVLGWYAPAVPMYKMLEEKRAAGSWLDYGWVVLFKHEQPVQADYDRFAGDYHLNDSQIIDGDFKLFFAVSGVYRKDTNITEFDYICIVGNKSITLPQGTLVFNESDTKIYDIRE